MLYLASILWALRLSWLLLVGDFDK